MENFGLTYKQQGFEVQAHYKDKIVARYIYLGNPFKSHGEELSVYFEFPPTNEYGFLFTGEQAEHAISNMWIFYCTKKTI